MSFDKVNEAFDILMSAESEESVCQKKPNLLYTSAKGRPSYKIPEETLLYFIEKGFTLKQMSDMLSVSTRTVSNRMEDYGLSIRQSYSSISDEELVAVVQQKVTQFPSIGYKSVKGHLMSVGIRITESRIRRIMREVDPLGVMLRNVLCRTYTIRRRSYSVRAPMALWHVDSNHKLIRWRFIFHGGIDGYSRLPVYLQVAADNTAATAFTSFQIGVQQYGIPERVRTDKGMENIRIAEFMLQNHGVEKRSHITGRSVHNQRIERFWRELWQGCTCTYYELFRTMEQDGILDVDNEVNLLSLHLVFLKRIQSSVDRFVHAVSNRPLRTEHNKTPMQMWIMGQFLDPKIQLTAEVTIARY
ncbi:uncharacterized protein LOC128240699 [Mya arenaria]|uniref:uncharacterized protein LOC128240699 n=1 Tax=Mya arenaria TaxID=6604 RepID=UPI0022E37962|nr:uncharacterized protein LOC128240699 [Mya arenaria]